MSVLSLTIPAALVALALANPATAQPLKVRCDLDGRYIKMRINVENPTARLEATDDSPEDVLEFSEGRIAGPPTQGPAGMILAQKASPADSRHFSHPCPVRCGLCRRSTWTTVRHRLRGDDEPA